MREHRLRFDGLWLENRWQLAQGSPMSFCWGASRSPGLSRKIRSSRQLKQVHTLYVCELVAFEDFFEFGTGRRLSSHCNESVSGCFRLRLLHVFSWSIFVLLLSYSSCEYCIILCIIKTKDGWITNFDVQDPKVWLRSIEYVDQDDLVGKVGFKVRALYSVQHWTTLKESPDC